jgi:2-keto-3-deoxy-6-phosphogluconate aldolase
MTPMQVGVSSLSLHEREAFAAMFGGGDALKLSPARRLSVASLRVAHRARIPRRLIPAGGVAPDNRRRS